MTSNEQFELTLDHLMRTIDLIGRTNGILAYEKELLLAENEFSIDSMKQKRH